MDIPAMAPLLTELGYPAQAADLGERFARICARPDFATFVAVVDGRVAGFIGACTEPSYTHDAPRGRILSLVVGSAFRRRGVGVRLVAAAEEWLAEAGAGAVIVTSRLHRADAHAFYEGLGYERTGLRFGKPLKPG